MKIEVLDKKGNKVEDLELNKNVFGQEPNPDLLAQYLNVYLTNQRQGTSSTKTRSEVSGGGKKPWRQKGTGRARHGSIRSPIWAHGGVAHGPRPKDYALSMPTKMKKKAMQCALSFKFKEGELKVINEIKMSKPATKEMSELMNKLNIKGLSLVVLEKKDERVLRSVSNLPKVTLCMKDSLSVFDILKAKQVLFEKNALVSLEKKCK